ncbi:hypothetical protein EVA_19252 [gut metagenome]|uniref:Uncharacterized protein n=1 Tax=gut metagenome TaxID=749906 RepID=J9BYK7_9ZZZZ
MKHPVENETLRKCPFYRYFPKYLSSPAFLAFIASLLYLNLPSK